jgi:hypothetical protein
MLPHVAQPRRGHNRPRKPLVRDAAAVLSRWIRDLRGLKAASESRLTASFNHRTAAAPSLSCPNRSFAILESLIHA